MDKVRGEDGRPAVSTIGSQRLEDGSGGIGWAHRRTRVIKIVDDLHVRIIDAATGELLRELTIDPTRDYQPTGRTRGPDPKNRKPGPQPGSGWSGIS